MLRPLIDQPKKSAALRAELSMGQGQRDGRWAIADGLHRRDGEFQQRAIRVEHTQALGIKLGGKRAGGLSPARFRGIDHFTGGGIANPPNHLCIAGRSRPRMGDEQAIGGGHNDRLRSQIWRQRTEVADGEQRAGVAEQCDGSLATAALNDDRVRVLGDDEVVGC